MEGLAFRNNPIPVMWQHTPHYAVGSPRRYSAGRGGGGGGLGGSGGGEALRSPALAGAEPPPSPLTRSRSANFSSGPALSGVHRGGLATLHGVDAELMTMSPQAPHRDTLPPRSRSVIQGVAPMPPPPTPQRNMGAYASGPSLPPATAVPAFPPPVQVAGTSAVATMAVAAATGGGGGCSLAIAAALDGPTAAAQGVLPSPRREPRVSCEDGFRSPPPAPPPRHTLGAHTRAPDRTPHSARSSLMGAAGGGGRIGRQHVEDAASGRAVSMRWDQASPCRARYVGGGAGSVPSAVGGVSASGATKGPTPVPTGPAVPANLARSVLGPLPKTAPPPAAAVAATAVAAVPGAAVGAAMAAAAAAPAQLPPQPVPRLPGGAHQRCNEVAREVRPAAGSRGACMTR